MDGEALTDAELLGFMFLLVVPGMETVVRGPLSLPLVAHPA